MFSSVHWWHAVVHLSNAYWHYNMKISIEINNCKIRYRDLYKQRFISKTKEFTCLRSSVSSDGRVKVKIKRCSKTRMCHRPKVTNTMYYIYSVSPREIISNMRCLLPRRHFLSCHRYHCFFCQKRLFYFYFLIYAFANNKYKVPLLLHVPV